MRLLHLIPKLSGGGTEQQLCYLAPELARMGHDVHIVYSREGPYKPELPGVVLHQLKSRSNYNPYLIWQLHRIIRCNKPDIIHTWILQMDILGGIAARFNGIPWILREPSSAMAYPPTWKNSLRVRVGSKATAIVSNSSGGDEYWKTRLPHSRRYIVPNGLPVHEIYSVAVALPSGLVKSEVPIVLYVGRLASDISAQKNLKPLLESLALVTRQQNVLGILCGEGPQRSELETLRHKLRLDECVHFTEHLPVTSVWALMKKASVFVSLSSYEGCPNSVMEAMVCGCPLVLSDIPAHREIIDERSALLVDPQNPAKIADAILASLSDPGSTRQRAAIAKEKSNQWSIEAMANQYVKVYQAALIEHKKD